MLYVIINKLNLKRNWPLVLLVIFFGWLFYSLLSSHMLLLKPDGLYSGGSTWGDLAFHLTLITKFTETGFSIKVYPLLYGEKLVYPPFMDMLSAVLVKLGFSLRNSLFIPGLLFSVFAVISIYIMVLHITKSRLAGFLTPFFFFLNGSLAGFYYFWKDFQISGLGLVDFLDRMTKDYAHLGEFNLRFSNIISNYMLPQRTVIPGLILGSIAVYFLWSYWETRQRKYLLYGGLAVSFTPLVHAHTFVAIIMAALFLTVIQLFENIKGFKKIISDWIWFALPILFIGLPQFAIIYPWGKESFTRFHFGWMKGEESIWVFWPKNLSPHIYLLIIAYWLMDSRLKKFATAFLGVFIVTNLFLFQPHDFDNMKIMLWPFLIFSLLNGWLVAYLFERFRYKGLPLIFVIIIGLVLVGSISVYREFNVSWRMYSFEDIQLAEMVKQNTPPDSLFLITDQHNHPVPTLAGRRVLMGFRGWLWTHGFNYRKIEADTFEIFSGGLQAKNLIEMYGIDYAVVDKSRVKDFNINLNYFAKNYLKVYENQSFIIYNLSLPSNLTNEYSQ